MYSAAVAIIVARGFCESAAFTVKAISDYKIFVSKIISGKTFIGFYKLYRLPILIYVLRQNKINTFVFLKRIYTSCLQSN